MKEYQIRPVTRYVVTEFTPAIDNGATGSTAVSKVIGEFANEQIAGTVWAAFTQNAITERDYPMPPTETPFPSDPLPSGVYVGNTGQIDARPV